MCFWHLPNDVLGSHAEGHRGANRGDSSRSHARCLCPDGGSRGMMQSRRPDIPSVIGVEDVIARIREVMTIPNHGYSTRAGNPSVGFVGFEGIGDGDEVLLVANDHYDDVVVEGTKRALQEAGAKVNVYDFHVEEDRRLTETDELDVIIRDEPYGEYDQPRENLRRYDYGPFNWVLDHIEEVGYDALIQGYGGPLPDVSYRMEAFPWTEAENLMSDAPTFPPQLNKLINEKTWEKIYKRGAEVHLTDPEGTDITYTQRKEYFRNQAAFSERPVYGHLMAHGLPPIPETEDARGVIRGTTSHFNRPFPRISVELEEGAVVDVDGGGAYGDAWRALVEDTEDIQYPGFPHEGLFWLWEVAIGTNPHVHRPKNTLRLSGGGTERERNRSGVIHCGIGTTWGSESERWAGERGLPYGHLHVHLLFPTLDVEHPDGKTHRVIDNGHLTALDDPEVRKTAEKYGDPEKLLSESWVPEIPGINGPGSYDEFAEDPASVIEDQLAMIER